MRYPGPHAREQLASLLLGVGFVRTRIVDFLHSQGMRDVAGRLPTAASDEQDVTAAVRTLSDLGHVTPEFLDALEAEPEFVPLREEFRLLRIEMEFAPPVDTLLSPAELSRVKEAAHIGRLHTGLGFVRLKAKLPASVRRYACEVVGGDAEKLDAWIDGANRQAVGPGDDVRMLDLLKVAIAESEQAGKAALEEARARVESTVLLGDVERIPEDRRGSVEQVVNEFGIATDFNEFLIKGEVAAGRICKITIGNDDMGTGFLVGSDLILTNHHVMKSVIAGMRDARDVRFTFDFRSVGDVPVSGPAAKLLTNGATAQNPRPWLIDTSPATDEELRGSAIPIEEPTPDDNLDFALCRLDTRIGEQNAPHGSARGFFSLVKAGPEFVFSRGTALIIIGHPTSVDDPRTCKPQIFAIEPDAVIAINPNKTRVRYRTNTLKGSSGSPVLSVGWELVALHHYGRKDQYNQGIPVAAIGKRPEVTRALEN
ncbi:MAG: hypothetical protein DBP02_17780 [gamma proteobacterium symbiont of Ctena orbiculata]|nr:MAG: hypothetical protein DBP02_17780 [gamma proteobacterium symbiont of Ctena orbiculata]